MSHTEAQAAAQRIHDHLKDIPDQDWTTHVPISLDRRRCCAVGHLRYEKGADGLYEFSGGYRSLVRDGEILCYTFGGRIIVDTNDGYKEDYQQDTPKKRMLAMLKDVISGKKA